MLYLWLWKWSMHIRYKRGIQKYWFVNYTFDYFSIYVVVCNLRHISKLKIKLKWFYPNVNCNKSLINDWSRRKAIKFKSYVIMLFLYKRFKETIFMVIWFLHFLSCNHLACFPVTLIRIYVSTLIYVSLGVFSAYEGLHLHKIWLLMVF